MRTVGQLLKEERLKKGFSLEQVEKSTKIRARFITAIETDDYAHMPAAPYLQGFVKNYSDFLGLRTSTIMALLRRQFTLKDRQKRETIEEPLTESGWKLTPNKVILVFVVILIGVLFSYFYSQYRMLHAPPPLALESPKQDAITREETIAVFGTTDHDATLTVNNEPVLISNEGKFYKDVNLTVGGNTITVIVTSRVGEKTTQTRQVNRVPEKLP